jgi:hypothetical protein
MHVDFIAQGLNVSLGISPPLMSAALTPDSPSWISIWRLRRSEGSSQRLPFVLCFIATVLPVCPAIYLIAFQSVIAAIAILIIVLFWSKMLARLSALDAWKRNAGWLLASVVGVLGIAFLAIKLDSGIGDGSLIGTLASSVFWVIVAVPIALTLILLNALRDIHSRIRS